jgi:hypothetical protein
VRPEQVQRLASAARKPVTHLLTAARRVVRPTRPQIVRAAPVRARAPKRAASRRVRAGMWQDEARRLGTTDRAGNAPKHTGPHLTGCGSDCESEPNEKPRQFAQRGESSLVGAAGEKERSNSAADCILRLTPPGRKLSSPIRQKFIPWKRVQLSMSCCHSLASKVRERTMSEESLVSPRESGPQPAAHRPAVKAYWSPALKVYGKAVVLTAAGIGTIPGS